MCNFKTSFLIIRNLFMMRPVLLSAHRLSHWLRLLRLFAMALCLWSIASTAAISQTIPCQVRLEFETTSTGQQLIHYRLFMQITNTKPRPITAVSVEWLNEQNEIIGNSDADCRLDDAALGLSQTGQCSRKVQSINQRWMEKLGQMIWTEMVNSELSAFRRIKSCKIQGYRFE